MKFTNVYRKNAKAIAQTRIVVNQGGTSSSKTYSALQLLWMIASKSKKRLLISVVSESLPHLKRGAMRDFENILKANGLYDRSKHNKTDNSYEVGESLIEFFSADNDSKLRGARRDILYMNECNNMSYEAYNQLEVRTKKLVILDYNPVASFWVHEKVLPQDGVSFIKSTYKDNEHLDEQIVKSIEARQFTDPNWWKVYGLGEVGSLEGVIFTNWDTTKEYPSEYKWSVYGQDFGFTNDPSALVEVRLAHGELWVRELIHQTGLTNTDLAEKYRKIGIERRDEIIADSAEPKSIEEIKRMGFNIKPANKGADSILNGIDILKRYKINVEINSTNIINELRHYQWQQDKDGNYINKPIDNFNHCFVGDTLITTINGQVPIKDIQIGDLVMTSEGYKEVLHKFNNGLKKVYKYSMQLDTFNVYLTCTKDHKIKTSKGWVEIHKLKKGMRLFLHKNLTEKYIDYMKEKDTSLEERKGFIELYGNIITDLFQKDTMYIMLMEIRRIMILKTLILLMQVCILGMKVKKGLKTILSSLKSFNLKGLRRLKNGTDQKKEENGIKNMEGKVGLIDRIEFLIVKYAEKNIKQDIQESQNTAIKIVKLKHYEIEESQIVYDLMVNECHEYYANGVLVHNCLDALRYVALNKIGKPKGRIRYAG